MNDRVLSGNFHTHTYINTQLLPSPSSFDPSVLSADPPPSQKSSTPLPSFTLLRVLSSGDGELRRRSSSVVPLPKHHLRSLPSSLTLLCSSFPATVRGGRRRVLVPPKSHGSSLFFSSSRGLHSSSSVSFVFVVFCVPAKQWQVRRSMMVRKR